MTSRNKHFRARRLFQDDALNLKLERAGGPFGFLNPTRAHFLYSVLTTSKSGVTTTHAKVEPDRDFTKHDDSDPNYPAKHVRFLWRSRDNRKGRHALLVERPAPGEDSRFLVPRLTSHPREVLRNIKKTFTYFPVWDISWLVAFIFTLGSMVWVLNGFFVWLPAVAPSTQFHNEILYGGGITAFVGAIIFFETGSILLVLEAINANNPGCFGWAVEQVLDHENGGKSKVRVTANRHHCRHHHQNRHNFVGKSSPSTVPEVQSAGPDAQNGQSWQWFPSWHDLHTHYLHELGFLAGAVQLFGATIFGISGFTALPGIIDHLNSQSALNGAYWIPQVMGGSGFIVSSILYMLETQKRWYIPAFRILGWHIGFWNLVGAVGFTLCGALGMAYGNSGAQYQAGLATFWGSWAFLIGSYLQLYESLNKYPVEEMSKKRSSKPMKGQRISNDLWGVT
ncbi:uncharacterized protein Z518_06639 [Rhinocladiella mackenziei CBS 650.93]|uniref:Integral membrane protein n=1 Tax=Rhinocladiella mackenziei CBS 650.93 TaxID=1442369 RepID=A0A0D2IB88_9EURO|nr:uncharacterized protein Z518_06639 [Rhinocladiella mackenziei CBS 650.93]KIX03089.1 hypothetical protein Z518_06639 [Rhinocladiella mackenziei CBS 650.93]